MVTVAAALQEIGYEFQVVSFVCVLVLLRWSMVVKRVNNVSRTMAFLLER